MIEIKKKVNKVRHDEDEMYINGELLDHVNCSLSEKQDAVEVSTRFRPSIDKIITQNLNDFLYRIAYIGLIYDYDYFDSLDSINISQAYDVIENTSDKYHSREFIYRADDYKILFEFGNITKWKRPYTIIDYHFWLTKVIEEYGDSSIKVQLQDASEGLRFGFSIEFPYSSMETQISKEIENHLEEIRHFDETVEDYILKQQKQNSVFLKLDVPDEIRVPYEQYLVYFSKFLEDLGVDVTSELQHEASSILFTVTPKDEKEALEKIRVALEVYLRLPKSPTNYNSNTETGIEVQRLTSNIQHLQSQLTLAKAEKQLQEALIEAKDTTIQALRFTITTQKKLLSGNSPGDVIDISPFQSKDKEKEDIIDGLVSLTKYEGQGFEINIPEIFRRLKELFKK